MVIIVRLKTLDEDKRSNAARCSISWSKNSLTQPNDSPRSLHKRCQADSGILVWRGGIARAIIFVFAYEGNAHAHAQTRTALSVSVAFDRTNKRMCPWY